MLDFDSIPHIHEIQALHGQFQDPGVKTRTDTFVERMHSHNKIRPAWRTPLSAAACGTA